MRGRQLLRVRAVRCISRRSRAAGACRSASRRPRYEGGPRACQGHHPHQCARRGRGPPGASTGRLVAVLRGNERAREDRGDGGPGTIVDFSMRPPGGRPFHAACTVVAWDHRADGSVHWRGEYSAATPAGRPGDLLPADGGASVTVEMEVVPEGGPVVRMAANLLVQRPLRRNVHQSLENLRRLVESAQTRSANSAEASGSGRRGEHDLDGHELVATPKLDRDNVIHLVAFDDVPGWSRSRSAVLRRPRR